MSSRGVFFAAIVAAVVVFVGGLPVMMGGRLVMACGCVMMLAGWMSGGHDGSKG